MSNDTDLELSSFIIHQLYHSSIVSMPYKFVDLLNEIYCMIFMEERRQSTLVCSALWFAMIQPFYNW